VGLAVREALGIPLVYDVRGFPEMTWAVRRGGRDAEVYERRRAAETRCMVYADAVFTLSGVMKDQIVSRGVEPEKVSVIPHFVDTAFFAPAPPPPALRERYGLEGRLVVGYVSSLLEYEGVDVLLRALAGAAPEAEGIAGLVVGDGPMLGSLEALADDLGIADRVTFAGRVPFSEIRDHYALIDVFVCPRRDLEVCRYVTPLKPFEAMSMERCVVVSDLPALAELTAGGTAGVTFPPDDPEALAAVLADLANQPDRLRALGRAARVHVETHHSTAAMTSAVLAGFDAVRGRAAMARC
jgi:glycosyltransferase involved in cell wall biosynthesis